MPKLKTLALSSIKIDGGTQIRFIIDQAAVTEYAERMEAKIEFPPVDVFFDGVWYWLADGFHRYWAADRIKAGKIAASVHDGDQRAAILFSVGANDKHGLRRSNADKRKAVGVLLADPEWSKKSSRWIAEAAAVSDALVNEIRQPKKENQLQEQAVQSALVAPEPTKLTGRDAKERSGPAPKKPKPLTEESPAPEPLPAPDPEPPKELSQLESAQAGLDELYTGIGGCLTIARRVFAFGENKIPANPYLGRFSWSEIIGGLNSYRRTLEHYRPTGGTPSKFTVALDDDIRRAPSKK